VREREEVQEVLREINSSIARTAAQQFIHHHPRRDGDIERIGAVDHRQADGLLTKAAERIRKSATFFAHNQRDGWMYRRAGPQLAGIGREADDLDAMSGKPSPQFIAIGPPMLARTTAG